MRPSSILAPAGAVVVAVGAWLPWVTIGPRRVSGFDLVTIARHYGLNRRAAGTVGSAWLCLPLLAGVALALALLGRSRWATAASMTVAVAGVTAAGLVGRATGWTLLVGAWLTVAGAVLVAAATLAGAFRPRRGSSAPGQDHRGIFT